MYQYPKQPDGNVDVHYTDVTFPATHTHTQIWHSYYNQYFVEAG